jgi:hypothetical protein
MTQKEFNERIMRQADIDEYAVANAVYLSENITGDKDAFCNEYRTLYKSSALFRELVATAKNAKPRRDDYEQTRRREVAQALLAIGQDIKAGIDEPHITEEIDALVSSVLHLDVVERIKMKLTRGYILSGRDVHYITEHLN